MSGIDLHIHTLHSDGELSPRQVLAKARELALDAVAITDHDCTDGVEEALREGVEQGVEVVPGVELSVRHGPFEHVHLLGYFVEAGDNALERHLTALRDSRLGRGKRLVERVNRKLMEEGREPIDFAEVEALAEKVVGRPHVAKVMLRHGLASSMMQAFQDYLVPLNIRKHKLGFGEAVQAVHEAGGVTVLAHPNLITRDRQDEVRLLDEAVRLGLEGLEVYYNNMSAEDTEHYRVLALERNLLITGGSDFHGYNSYGNMGRVHGGRLVPSELLETLKQAFFRRRTFLAVFLLDEEPHGNALSRALASMAGCDLLSAREVLLRSVPGLARGEETLDPVRRAGDRILVLESELRLARRKSAVLLAPGLEAGACSDLASMARRAGGRCVFVVPPDRAEELASVPSPCVLLRASEGKPSLAPLHRPDVLAYFLCHNL